MVRLHYTCTLLTDVVLSSTGATEGFHRSLDYIPGAKFLGITAGKFYKMDELHKQRTLDLFHNGSVRFGDAHPVVHGERLPRIPAGWHYPKGEEGTIYLHHLLDPDIKADLIEQKDIQLKQARDRFISWRESEAETVIESYVPYQQFSIKSGYDTDSRKARDGRMYGYFGLQAGTVWRFYVDLDKPVYKIVIDEALVGKRRIGRSKSAEYGLVEIKSIGETTVDFPKVKSGTLLLYADSNLCFYDENGKCTLRPTPEQLKLPKNSKIDWEKSQIRSRMYRTWNQHRQNRDADRLIIRKGSVFCINLADELDGSVYREGIGAHRAEGFGQVQVNPPCLMAANETTRQLPYPVKIIKGGLPKEIKQYTFEGKEEQDKIILAFLNYKKSQQAEIFDVLQRVNMFIDDYLETIYYGISNSQWGQLRRLAKIATTPHIFYTRVFSENGFLNRGQTQSTWRKKGRKEHLKKYLFGNYPDGRPNGEVPEASILDFTMKLAAEMAKTKEKEYVTT